MVEEVLYQYGCMRFGEVRKRYARRSLWGLQEESREFGLGDYGGHRERSPDISFPVRVFGRIGSYIQPTHAQALSHNDTTQ